MTAALLDVETADFAYAARRLAGDVGDPLTTALVRLAGRLSGCGAMAGSDPGGLDWARSYDRAAQATLRASGDVLNGCLHLAAMFTQTARNYEAADAASAGHAVAVALPDPTPIGLAYELPSAAGGSNGPPGHWGLIGHLVGYVWPNGHPDRLRAAATAWTAGAGALWTLSEYVAVAAVPAMGDRIPEQADMTDACDAMYLRMRRLAAEHRALASACAALASHIEQLHSEVAGELASLVEWTAAIEGAGAVLSIFSFGAAEVPTQAVEAARVGATAARVSALIEKFLALARDVEQAVAGVLERADRIAAELVGLRETRLSAALIFQARTMPLSLRIEEVAAQRRLEALAAPLPDLRVATFQLERKFKHAAAFGVAIGRGKSGFAAFNDAMRVFLARTDTSRVIGTYRGAPAVLNYSVKSRLVIIQKLDGEFVSCWRLRRTQMLPLIEKRSLGGG